MPRAEFRKSVEATVRNSFMHSLLAKGRLLYTHDETIARLCGRLNEIGERDTQVQLLSAAAGALLPIDKAHKWFVTRGDLNYSALWILYAATPLARIEVIGARLLAVREEDAQECAGGVGRDRQLPCATRVHAVPAGARSSERGRGSAILDRD